MAETGMRRANIIDLVAERALKIEVAWLSPSASAQSRMELLAECVLVGLGRIGVPRPLLAFEKMAADRKGEYSLNTWTLKLNQDGFISQQLEIAFASCLESVYHETRHHEQNYRAERYRIRHLGVKYLAKKIKEMRSSHGKPTPGVLTEWFGIPAVFTVPLWGYVMGGELAGDELTRPSAGPTRSSSAAPITRKACE